MIEGDSEWEKAFLKDMGGGPPNSGDRECKGSKARRTLKCPQKHMAVEYIRLGRAEQAELEEYNGTDCTELWQSV